MYSLILVGYFIVHSNYGPAEVHSFRFIRSCPTNATFAIRDFAMHITYSLNEN